ncbi:MAG: AMP-binding protein [Synergistaceae bacterium]|nr:AMP-binding protein [Synergistaceae bacterium]
MLNEIIHENVCADPDAQAYWWDGVWHTRGELWTLSSAYESSLQSAGFSKGQRLAALMPDCPATLALMLAVWRLGGAVCPLNEKAGATSLTKTLALLKPFVVVVSDSVKGELTGAIEEAGFPCVVCHTDDGQGPFPSDGLPSFEGTPAAPDPENLAVIFSTSGTTGEPKAVPLTHDNLADNCRACLEHVPALKDNDNIFLNVLPNFHAFGFTISGLLPLFLGAPQVLVPSFMPPQNVLRAVEEAGANILLLVPTMVGFLTSMLERAGRRMKGIKILIAGGDRYNVKIDSRVTSAFGVPLMEGYGITECSPVLAVNPDPTTRRLGTVGRPLPRFELQLRDENGKVLQGANEGVLWTRGPSVAAGYYHDPEATAERFDKDGALEGGPSPWFNTGDYVKLEDGRIRIIDRVTDIIIVGGFNVYPQEVEAALAEHPAVLAAAVVGVPSGISGEVPKAFVVRDKDTPVTDAELIRFCKAHLSHYKVPRSVEFVDTLPISSTGKILRRVLRQREKERSSKNA